MTDLNGRKSITVSPDGSGDFQRLSDAVAAQQNKTAPVRFVLAAGVYAERPFIELADYEIVGAGQGRTVITAGVGGLDPWPGEAKTGTFRSQTLFLGGGLAVARDLTVENTAGDGHTAGQALAVYADAARVCMADVTLLGNQDTLFTAPLPPTVREPNGFRGPREGSPRLPTRQYYRNCTIAGNIDFIFGGAQAVFDSCNIVPLPCHAGVCYIAAPCTPPGRPGYLFAHCCIAGDCPQGSVYLGRPWRSDAAAFYLDCALSAEVSPAGWNNWDSAANEQTVRFGESGCFGAGAVPQRAFGSVNNAAQTAAAAAQLAAFRQEFAPLLTALPK